MISQSPKRLLLFLVILSLTYVRAYAQPTLPDIVGVTQKGMNILSWTNQYDGIKSIAVQRSGDSTYNFVSIGYVKNLKKGPQAFIDGHPNPGKNWYRLYIVFNSDLTWYSNRMKIFVDSAQLLQQRVLPSNDSLQKLAGKVKFNDTTAGGNAKKPVLSVSSDAVDMVDAYAYIKSEYVFTNPFTGHINVELKDSKQHNYSLVFYDQKEKRVLEIHRIAAPAIIIDKRNFQRKGMYRFELMRDKEKLEAGFITIY